MHRKQFRNEENMKTINLVMIAKNEERCLKRCLESARPLVDEIILVDTGSVDKTKQIASEFGAKLFDFQWVNDFSAARNFALQQSDSDWNLVLDADEYLAEGTRKELNSFLETPNQLGAIQRRDAYPDNGEISYGISYTTRLLPRGVFFTGKIHEQVDSSLPRIPLPLVFDHDGYMFVNKSERNLPMLIAELTDHPDDSYLLYQIAATYRNLNQFQQAAEYFQQFYQKTSHHENYWVRGITSYLYTLIELKDFDKALELVLQEEPGLSQYADFEFACGIFFMKLVLSDVKKYISYLPNIEASYLKCLNIGEISQHQGVLGTGSFKAAYNLGTWYEVSGNMQKAKYYYQQAARDGYDLAINRLKTI